MRSRLAADVAVIAMLIVASVISPRLALAQSSFLRNDSYDFRGLHTLSVRGQDPDHMFWKLTTDSDFRTFKLHIKCGGSLGFNQAGPYWINRIEMDVNADGSVEAYVDRSGVEELTYTYVFPEPSNGISQSHVISYTVMLMQGSGSAIFRSMTLPVTVYAAPRVFVDPEGNTFVQVRNREPGAKVPILVVEGIDPINAAFSDTYYKGTFDFVNGPLEQSGCEVFFLNFKEGGISLRHNAEVLKQALIRINQLCPNNEIAVVGISMGGVITRYALAKAEDEGLDLHVGLFVSFDSPQKAAHANRVFQDDVRSAGNQVQNDALVALQTSLSCEAAQEMLDYCTYNPTGIKHLEFYNELNALNGDGYPHHAFNGAISNGNYNASWPIDRVGDPLATMSFFTEGAFDQGYEVHVYADATDCGSGSLANLTQVRGGAIFAWPVLEALISVYFQIEVLFNPVYMPTWSTLDLQNYSVDQYTGNVNPVGQSKFDAVTVQTTPLLHGDVSTTSAGAILQWLGRTSTLTINYNLLEGGAVGADTQTVPILRGGVVTINPKTLTVNGQQVTYVFDHWDDGSTANPRNVYASKDTSRTVTMKAHLATTSSGEWWANNERRIAEAVDGGGPTYHAVYESGEVLWSLRNRRNAGWEQERCIWAGSPGATHPTIATQSFSRVNGDLIQVHVAWRLNSGSIMYRASGVDNGITWMPPVEHHVGAAPSTLLLLAEPNPGTGPGAPFWPALIWAADGGHPEFEDSGIFFMKQPQVTGSDGQGSTYHLVPGTAGHSSCPVAVSSGDCGHGYGHGYQLTFIRDGKLYVEEFWGGADASQNDRAAPPVLCAGPVDLTTSGWTPTNPSMVRYGTNVFLAWEESDGANRRIGFKQQTSGIWGPSIFFTHLAHVPTKPVLGIDQSCGKINLLWECSGQIARVTRSLTGALWDGIEHLATGLSPSIVESGIYKAVPMWPDGTRSPYKIFNATTIWCASVSSSGSGAPGGGGCPFADVRTASGWDVENSLLSRSLTGAIGVDAYCLTHVPVLENGKLSLRIRENEHEATTLDRVRAIAVDHEPGLEALATTSGGIVVGTRMPAYRVTTASGIDVTNLVTGEAGSFFVGLPGDTLTVEMEAPASRGGLTTNGGPAGPRVLFIGDKECCWMTAGRGDEAARGVAVVSTDEMVLNNTGVDVQVHEPVLGWRTVRRLYPREFISPVVLDSMAAGPMRLIFIGQHRLGYVGQVLAEGGATTQTLTLASAQHSRLGDVRLPVVNSDGVATQIVNGDTLNLKFSASAVPSGNERDYFLVSTGVYTTLPSIREPSGPVVPLPAQFSLAQNQPNPFKWNTTIRFALPAAAPVKLEVFDLQGRRIAVLADRIFSPGYQALDWDRRDGSGSLVAPGVYLYRLKAGSFTDQKKMVLLAN